MKQEQHLDDQLEELSRIKLEDIDELNSYLSTDVQKQEELNNTNNNSRHSQGNFVTNLFRNGLGLNRTKENTGANDLKLPVLGVAKPSKLKLDLENNSMLNVDFDDELMISLINDTKSDMNNNSNNTPDLNQIMNFQMNSHDIVSKFDDTNKPSNNAELTNNSHIESMSLLTVDTSNPVDAIQASLAFQLDQIQQQSLDLENFADNNEFFLDTDIILENSNQGETKSN